MDSYKTVDGTAYAEIEEKRSRFLSCIAFADTEEKAVEVLNAIRAKHRTANHNVYAYLLREGARTRYSDDGEPAKTSGLPTLEAIRHAGLVDCIVVTTRYFGGTLLGTGGLVRAYTASAAEGLKHSEIITRFHGFKLRIASDYTSLGKIQHLLAQRDICILESVYTDKVELVVLVPDEEEGALYKEIMDGTNGQADLEKEQECWFAQTEDGMKIFEE